MPPCGRLAARLIHILGVKRTATNRLTLGWGGYAKTMSLLGRSGLDFLLTSLAVQRCIDRLHKCPLSQSGTVRSSVVDSTTQLLCLQRVLVADGHSEGHINNNLSQGYLGDLLRRPLTL